MQALPFEAVYEVSLYTDDVLVDQFVEVIDTMAFNTEEAYNITKSLLYAKLAYRRPEVPYENYAVKLKKFDVNPQTEAKNKYLKISTLFYLSTGMEFLFTTLCIRYILIVSILTGLALYFDKPFLSIAVLLIPTLAAFAMIVNYDKILTRRSHTWLVTVILLTNLLQALII